MVKIKWKVLILAYLPQLKEYHYPKKSKDFCMKRTTFNWSPTGTTLLEHQPGRRAKQRARP